MCLSQTRTRFSTLYVLVRSDSLFWRYWWNGWPSLLQFPFHNSCFFNVFLSCSSSFTFFFVTSHCNDNFCGQSLLWQLYVSSHCYDNCLWPVIAMTIFVASHCYCNCMWPVITRTIVCGQILLCYDNCLWPVIVMTTVCYQSLLWQSLMTSHF